MVLGTLIKGLALTPVLRAKARTLVFFFPFRGMAPRLAKSDIIQKYMLRDKSSSKRPHTIYSGIWMRKR